MMPRLTVRGPSGNGVSHRFDLDLVTIGRSADSDLVLDDAAVSRVHAEILRDGDRWIVADRQSHNGTRLNGEPLAKPATIAAGDSIGIGRMVVVFEDPAASAEQAARWLPTMPLESPERGDDRNDAEPTFVGRSVAVLRVIEAVATVAPSDATVLVSGESGTGKELIARLIHARSRRAAGPLVVVNCPALAESLVDSELFGVEKGTATGVDARVGRLEAAAGGTLVLDEVADLSAAAQAKLLRFLETKSIERVGGRKPVAVDVRIIAATNHDLVADVKMGSFRRDLHHRLDVVRVELPPLRTRREDVPLLVEHFLRLGDDAPPVVSPEAMEALMRHDYPGNVRELRHAVERGRLFAVAGVIRPEHLPSMIASRCAASRVQAQDDALDRLYADLISGRASFWEDVRGPFLRRELARDAVRALVQRAHVEAGGSYKAVARLFRAGADHKKLLNFLWQHDLRVKD